jgi:Rad3-related DNA helicase
LKEGVDLRGELGRFQILLKMPWASLGDKVVKERMERDPQWYAYKCILDVLQSLGRIVRSREDWGFSYLLDSGFESVLARNGHMIPGWVKAAFRRELPKEIRRV